MQLVYCSSHEATSSRSRVVSNPTRGSDEVLQESPASTPPYESLRFNKYPKPLARYHRYPYPSIKMQWRPDPFATLCSSESKFTNRAPPSPSNPTSTQTSRGTALKLCRTTTELSRQSYRIVRTSGPPARSIEKSPHPISGTSLRIRIIRSIQFN